MPRIARRAAVHSEIAAPVLTAAAVPVDTTQPQTTTGGSFTAGGWKKAAWDAYDTVGELAYVCERIANSLKRVSLYAAEIDPTTGRASSAPTENQTVAGIVSDIAGGPAGRASMIAKLVTHLTVPGEGWIAVITRRINGDEFEEWHVLSADEIKSRGTDITLLLDDGTSHAFDPSADILTRVYRPHPRNSRDSTSPVRAALPILSEITRTSEAIDGAGKSRLAGNGILLLPSEISMPVTEAPRPDPDAPGLTTGGEVTVERSVTAQDVMAQLQQVMTTAIADHTSAAAMVPIVLKASGEHLDKIRHLSFESEVTETNLKTRDSAIRRLGLSLDIPPEILTGVGGTNHWNAWAISEDAINTHFAPLMTLICDALTEAILRPLLRQAGINPADYIVWFDLSDLANNPNRAKDALDAFDRGAISPGTLRRELGFSDDDAPVDNLSPHDQRQLAIQMVQRAPSLFPMLAPVLGITGADTSASPAGTSARDIARAVGEQQPPQREE